MRTTTRLTGFACGLVAVLGLGAVVGNAVAPHPTRVVTAPAPIGQGVVAAAEHHRLLPEATELDSSGGPLRFTIADQVGQPVRDFTVTHDKELHLVIVNREPTEMDAAADLVLNTEIGPLMRGVAEALG